MRALTWPLKQKSPPEAPFAEAGLLQDVPRDMAGYDQPAPIEQTRAERRRTPDVPHAAALRRARLAGTAPIRASRTARQFGASTAMTSGSSRS
ncbi:hypothetical protein [Streptomyces sp. 3213.3]|uniref:hypothetical protein n=1 Tax=Streptomyces sp. 3213.3 TaxID=1855348 RepID=UPI00190ECF41|nr:hypothetical protein [Streptomyces sp. 3213.3]